MLVAGSLTEHVIGLAMEVHRNKISLQRVLAARVTRIAGYSLFSSTYSIAVVKG